MQKSKRIVKSKSKKRKHIFSGESQALRLTDWLNRNRANSHYRRVVGILNAILEIHNAMAERGQVKVEERMRTVAKGKFRLLEPNEETGKQAMEINRELQRYKMWPQFHPYSVGDRLFFGWSSKQHGSQAVLEIVHLCNEGLLNRVRRCRWEECESWFYAKFNHQYFCQTKCRQAHHGGSSEWRAHRREYMREYMRMSNRRRLGG